VEELIAGTPFAAGRGSCEMTFDGLDVEQSGILAECPGYNAPLRQLSSPPAAVSSDAPLSAFACDWRLSNG